MNITILGVGMIGGSFGLALKKYAPNDEPIFLKGLCRRQETAELAESMHAVDQCIWGELDSEEKIKNLVADADLIYLSVPVLQIIPLVKKILPFVKNEVVLTDAGSTKTFIWNEMMNLLNAIHDKKVFYVSAHPMTGREQSSVRAANPDLFVNKCYVIIKESEQTAPPDVLNKVKHLFKMIGGNLTTINLNQHDRCASMISHIPHVTAAALVTLLKRNEQDLTTCLDLAGGGFKDTTRIASSDADMWSDICMTNDEEIKKHLREMQKIFEDVIQAIDKKDRAKIHEYFRQSKEIRDSILEKTGKYFDLV